VAAPSARCAEIEALWRRVGDGGRRAPAAFEELTQSLLSLTVVPEGQRVVLKPALHAGSFLLEGMAGMHKQGLVRLNNGRWLQIRMTLKLVDGSLALAGAVFQYLWDDAEQSEIFRYDYARWQHSRHPRSHLNVHGTLDHGEALRDGDSLKDLHFPTGHTSLEAVVRLLIEDFEVGPNQPEQVWRPVLTASEEHRLANAAPQASGAA